MGFCEPCKWKIGLTTRFGNAVAYGRLPQHTDQITYNTPMHVVRTYYVCTQNIKYVLEIFDIELLIHMVRLAYELIRSTCSSQYMHQLINLHLIKCNLS